MKPNLVVAVVVALTAGGFAAYPAHASTRTDGVEVKLLAAINEGRAVVDKASEVMHSGLRAKARAHSAYMASIQTLTHDGAAARVSRATPDPAETNAAPDDGFGTWCENIAYWYPGSSNPTDDQVAKQLYTMWFNSSGHKSCMFDESGAGLNVAGSGIYLDSRGYWWATFISVRDTTPPPGWRRVEQKASAVTYSGTGWTTTSTSSASAGSFARSRTAGDKVVFTFKGTAVDWLGATGRYGGLVEVRLDGSLVATVDCYSSGGSWRAVLFKRTGLAPVVHRLELKMTGKQNGSSSSTEGYVDAFDFFS